MNTTFIRSFKCKILFFAFSLVMSSIAWSADEYRIDYQIEQLDAHGVTTIQKYSEKMIRDEQNIWIERLNTQAHAIEENGHGQVSKSEAHEHESFDSAIQWMQNKANQFQYFYILPDEKMRVQLNDVDQEMLGIKNCWRCEYSLINPEILKRAQLIQDDMTLQHYQIHSAGQTLNITWNMQDKIVQKYQMLKPTSGYTKKFTVRKMGQHVATPWTQIEKYSDRAYADFSD